MASRSIDTRLRYLDDASQRLLVSSPAVSAHIQAKRNSTLEEIESETDAAKSQSCNACGTILILGWSCKAIMDGRTSLADRPKAYPKTAKLRCSICGAITTRERSQRADKPHEMDSKISTKGPDLQLNTSKRMPTTKPQVASQLSTRRSLASARRKRGSRASLQAMLADQTKVTDSQSPKEFGMDLKDLMQR